jgi:hypothetical protein
MSSFNITFKKPGDRLFVLLLLATLGVTELWAQADPPRMLPFEHGHQQAWEAHLLDTEGKWEHGAVKPSLVSQRYLQLQRDTIYNTSKRAKSWLHQRLFSSHLLQASGSAGHWGLEADLLADLQLGRNAADGEITWLNTRGARLQGHIGNKFAFGTEVYENQGRFPAYIDSFVQKNQVMPGQGIALPFGAGWSYVSAQTYLAYQPNAYVNVAVGQGRQFLGHGYRSLFLADAGFTAPYLRVQTELGPLQHTYWLQQMLDINSPMLSYTQGYRQKYSAMSYFNLKAHRRWELGLFQAVVWQAEDGQGNRRNFPLHYLNPIIFFHSNQFYSGSEGNLLLGFNSQFQLWKHAFLYGQLMLDELYVREFLRQTGAPVNKYGVQLGLKSHQAFRVPHLFAQIEANFVRPYTYSHWSSLTNYAHYGQPLAHPGGANFREVLARADYRLPKGWFVQSKLVFLQYGLDSAGVNFGQDINRSYVGAANGFTQGVWILQGDRSDLWHLELLWGKRLNPKSNFQAEARVIYRQQGTSAGQQQTLWFMLGLRSALRNLYYDF